MFTVDINNLTWSLAFLAILILFLRVVEKNTRDLWENLKEQHADIIRSRNQNPSRIIVYVSEQLARMTPPLQRIINQIFVVISVVFFIQTPLILLTNEKNSFPAITNAFETYYIAESLVVVMAIVYGCFLISILRCYKEIVRKSAMVKNELTKMIAKNLTQSTTPTTPISHSELTCVISNINKSWECYFSVNGICLEAAPKRRFTSRKDCESAARTMLAKMTRLSDEG